MLANEKFRVNYFVGGGLAQGGDLWIDGLKVVFSPTSALDRAMGAKDVEIRLEEIRGLDYAGALSRTFLVKTDAKAHKFEGGQAKRVWEALDRALPKSGAPPVEKAPVAAAHLACSGCSKTLEPYFSFCPYCATRIKTTCVSCHKTVNPAWSACASCGWKFSR